MKIAPKDLEAKPDEMLIKYGIVENVTGGKPDCVYSCGDLCDVREGREFVHGIAGRFRDIDGEKPSLLERLESHGYDLTTLHISIRKRAIPQGSAS